MFAARANQENALHHPQLTKSLAPKTPSGKTSVHPGGGKNNENVLPLPGKTGVQPDRNAFVTPANPRTRAPLGNKTTNAKATAVLQPITTTTKPAPPNTGDIKSRRAHPKIKVHASTTTLENPLSPEREMEYMAPREIPMVDHELDEDIFPRDRDLSCLQGKNLTRGWWGEYAPREWKDDEGEFSDLGEKIRDVERRRKVVENAKVAKVGSARAKSAVGALSKRENAVGNVREKKPLTGGGGGGGGGARSAARITVSASGNPRFTAAKVASNSTIGYSKGRVVSRPKLATIGIKPVVEEKKTTLDDLLTGFGDLGIDDDEADSLGLGGGFGDIRGEEEDEDVFQLEAVCEEA